MRKFITRLSFFVLPFVALYGINSAFYDVKEGDLTRIGLIYGNRSPRSEVTKKYAPGAAYFQLCEWRKALKNVDVVTIGDSFSDQAEFGYQAYLANEGYTVLDVDRQITRENPIQTLIDLCNGDFFDSTHVETVVLECVEREFITRCNNLHLNGRMTLSELRRQFPRVAAPEKPVQPIFFSKATLTVPYTNLQYLFTERPGFSQTVRLKAGNHRLFTNAPADLLFYQDDVLRLSLKNDAKKLASAVEKLAPVADLLRRKHIRLLVMIAPDKYDIYSRFGAHNPYSKALFFGHYQALGKPFKNLDVYALLKHAVDQGQKDVYYYDDSHWSPAGAQLVGKALHQAIVAEMADRGRR